MVQIADSSEEETCEIFGKKADGGALQANNANQYILDFLGRPKQVKELPFEYETLPDSYKLLLWCDT